MQTSLRERLQDGGCSGAVDGWGMLEAEVHDAKQGVDADMRMAVDAPDRVSGGRDGSSRYYDVGGTGSPLVEEGEYAESWKTRERAKERLRVPTTKFVGWGLVPEQMRC